MKSIGKNYLHVTFLSVLSLSLFSEPDFYGKINVSYENAKKSSVQDTGFENNASRIGVKGKFKLLEGINISYLIDIEIDPTDTEPLEPQQEQRIITDLGESPSDYIPSTIFLNKKEGKVLTEQPRVTIPKKIVRSLEAPKVPKPKELLGQMLPKHILPRYVLRPGQPFLYEIPKDSTDEFYSFRWENQPPKGMYFLYESKAINWIPSEKQLDAFPISYMVRMKIDEIMEATSGSNESKQVFKSTPVLESRDESIWVYVNDPPRFLTEPTITEFIAGSKFS